MSYRPMILGLLLGIVSMMYALSPSLYDAWQTFQTRRGIAPEVVDLSASLCESEKLDYIHDILVEGYIDHDKVVEEKMEENAIKGYVEAIGDPHTEYLTKKENTVFSEGMEGSQHFDGIGAVVSKKKDGIMITDVLKGSPASLAGLRPLDLILQIDGVSTQSMELGDAVDKIRGLKGTTVTLSIWRASEDDLENTLFEIVVTRDAIDVPSVTTELIMTGGISILRIEIAVFGEDTIKTLRQQLLQLSGSYAGVILDLRGNGGGYLPTAVELASFFLPENEVVTTAKYALFPDEILRSEGYGDFLGKPLVVLIDGLSASASEIVAGALQQRAGATLVGTKSFGKGSIQTIQPLTDGSMLKYTIGKRYLPNGETIDHTGITPTIEIPFDRALFASGGLDIQLEKGIEALGGKMDK